MALNNKGGFNFDMEDRLRTGRGANTDTRTDAYTDTDGKETKTKRTYGLVQQSVFDKVTAYAKAHDTSFNAIVCELLDEFIAKKGL